VIQKSAVWGANPENSMFVVGATKAEQFDEIRKHAPEHFLLVPGVGAQGGDLAQTAKRGLNKEAGLLVNLSRGIIFAEKSHNFAQAARLAAKKTRNEMADLLEKYAG
jgi:orotidine-5'-phosphate decarboxylase